MTHELSNENLFRFNQLYKPDKKFSKYIDNFSTKADYGYTFISLNEKIKKIYKKNSDVFNIKIYESRVNIMYNKFPELHLLCKKQLFLHVKLMSSLRHYFYYKENSIKQ